jgi:DNA helicase II / ATP-dependent DNA helicase PcrA
VDEYQDTNHAQYVFLLLLAGGPDGGNLMVVGDDDQSIYGWRGADIRNILDFEKDFPGRAAWCGSSRTTARPAASSTRRTRSSRRTRSARARRCARTPARASGSRIVSALDERDEADWIGGEIEARMPRPDARLRDFVVLYRTNAQSRALEEAFRRRDLPYQIIGGTRFYERREIMDVMAYLRLISNPRDAGAFDRIINYPRAASATRRARGCSSGRPAGADAAGGRAARRRVPDLRGGAAAAFVAFAGMIQRYTALAAHIGVGELVEKLIAEIGIIDALRDEGPEGATASRT